MCYLFPFLTKFDRFTKFENYLFFSKISTKIRTYGTGCPRPQLQGALAGAAAYRKFWIFRKLQKTDFSWENEYIGSMQFVKGFYLLHFEGNRVSEFFSTSFRRHFSPKILVFPLRFLKGNQNLWHPPLNFVKNPQKLLLFVVF